MDKKLVNCFSINFNLSAEWIITIVGLLGNSVVLFILSRKKFRHISMFRYYFVSVVFDSIRILTLMPHNLADLFRINVYSIVFKLANYTSNVIALFVSFINIIASVDRYVNTVHHHKYKIHRRIKFQVVILSAALVLSFGIEFPLLFFEDKVLITNYTSMCESVNPLISFAIDMSQSVFLTMIPFMTNLVLNCLTGCQLIKKKICLKRGTFKKEKKLFKMLVSIEIFLFLCYFAWFAYVITNDVFNLVNIASDSMPIIHDIAEFIYYMYPAGYFFVFLASSKKFRKYFKSIFNTKRKKKNA